MYIKRGLSSCRFSAFLQYYIAIAFSARCVLSWCFCCRLQRVDNSCVSSFRLQSFRQSFRLSAFVVPAVDPYAMQEARQGRSAFLFWRARLPWSLPLLSWSCVKDLLFFRSLLPDLLFPLVRVVLPSALPVPSVIFPVRPLCAFYIEFIKQDLFTRPSRGPRPVCSFADISNGRKRQLTISTQCNSNNGNSSRQPEDLPIIFFTAGKKDLLPVQ